MRGGSDSDSDMDEIYPQDDAPLEMIFAANHMTTVEIGGAESIDRYLSCPICLSIVSQPTATEVTLGLKPGTCAPCPRHCAHSWRRATPLRSLPSPLR